MRNNMDSMARKPSNFTPAPLSDALKFPVSTPAHRSEAHLENLVQQTREANAQEQKNSEYLAIMAGTLQELKAAREQSDLQQDEQNGFNKRMAWVAALLAIGSIAASIVMPFVEHALWPTP